MFETYGNFDSAEEINAKAEELFNAGDTEGITELAKENGLPEEFAQAYIEGEMPMLCDTQSAADGKLTVETDALGAEGIMEDWVTYIRDVAFDSVEMAQNVRKRNRSLVGVFGRLAAYSMEHAETLPPEVIEAMGKAVTDEQLKKLGVQRQWLKYTKFGVPSMRTAKEIIRAYYGEA